MIFSDKHPMTLAHVANNVKIVAQLCHCGQDSFWWGLMGGENSPTPFTPSIKCRWGGNFLGNVTDVTDTINSDL